MKWCVQRLESCPAVGSRHHLKVSASTSSHYCPSALVPESRHQCRDPVLCLLSAIGAHCHRLLPYCHLPLNTLTLQKVPTCTRPPSALTTDRFLRQQRRRHHPPIMTGYSRPLSFSERRGSVFNDELALNTHSVKMPQQRPRGPPTPSMSTPAADFDQQLTGSPPPPPTPAASPGPSHTQPNWSSAEEDEEIHLSTLRKHFLNCTSPQRTRLLADLLNLCTSQQLSFVHQFVSPLLKKDPFTSLPDELCLRVCWVPTFPPSWTATDPCVFRSCRLSTTPRFWPEHLKFRDDGGIF
jgi:hypothetical protein